MSRSRVALAVGVVVAAIVIQTTVFAQGRIQPLGFAPALVTLVIVALSVYLEPEYLLLVGFTAGILVDLMGSSTLGLWAMTLTAVAYIAGRLKQTVVDRPFMLIFIVFGATVFGQFLYVLLATLFGHDTISEPRVLGNVVMPAVWNVLLAVPVFWILSKIFNRTTSRLAV